MTIRPRAVRALREVRERLRDAAAATHAHAANTRDSASASLHAERVRLEHHLDRASAELAEATTIHALDRIAAHTGGQRLAVLDAITRHSEAAALADDTARTLRERTRELRSAERILENLEEHRARCEATAEQRGHDDLGARRRRPRRTTRKVAP